MVFYIENEENDYMIKVEKKCLWEMMEFVEWFGVEIVIFVGYDIVEIVVEYVWLIGVINIVVGKLCCCMGLRFLFEDDFEDCFIMYFDNVDMYIIFLS